jgi:hypothetical protein
MTSEPDQGMRVGGSSFVPTPEPAITFVDDVPDPRQCEVVTGSSGRRTVFFLPVTP